MAAYDCILLVEDDENDVFLLEYAFEQVGLTCPVSVVGDGQQAIQYLSRSGSYADTRRFPAARLVVLDLKLPMLSGIDVLRWITQRPELDRIPVLVLTSSRIQSDVDAAYGLGAQAFLVKPCSHTERMRIAEFIRQYWFGSAPRLWLGTPVDAPLPGSLIVFVAGLRNEPRPELAFGPKPLSRSTAAP